VSRVALLLAVALLLPAAGCTPVVACQDGSHSTPHGAGTCAGHGGPKETTDA
jgi:hypothetical protein